MTITHAQHQAAYQVGQEFHRAAGKLSIAEAKKRLESTGLNEESALIFIYNIRHLMRGERYTRGMSEAATDAYLTWILRDYGAEPLRNALSALEKHIAYRRQEKTPSQCPGMVRLLKKHRALLPATSQSTPIPAGTPLTQEPPTRKQPSLAPSQSSFILEWRDEQSAGCTDWLPLAWFAAEGETKMQRHLVGKDARPQGEAVCDVRVTPTTAELDYQPYRTLNDPNEVLPGILRLTFADPDRTSIAGIAWKSPQQADFALSPFRLHTPFIAPAAQPYQPPATAAPKTTREVRDRPGQLNFRRTLRHAYSNRCCISKCTIPEVLESAHIDPYLGDASDHIQNGLLLRADLHTLFDRHLIAIDPDTHRIHVATSVQADPAYAALHHTPLQLPHGPASHPDTAALRRHWQQHRTQ